jgi:uncharacterized membrane protein YhaH (DUF805 family)
MTFDQIIQLMTTYEGRINRAKYWIAFAIYMATVIVLGLIAVMLGALTGGILLIIVGVIVYIPIVISGVFVGMKRLHDRGKSGWWLIVFYGIPGALNLVAGDGIIVSLISAGVSIWGFVELGCLKGDTGPNAYGPDPLQS